MKEFDRDHSQGFVLSTGREFYANCGILGMDIFGSGITEGYDGGVDEEEFTRKEKREIAKYMIRAWKMYRRNARDGRRAS